MELNRMDTNEIKIEENNDIISVLLETNENDEICTITSDNVISNECVKKQESVFYETLKEEYVNNEEQKLNFVETELNLQDVKDPLNITGVPRSEQINELVHELNDQAIKSRNTSEKFHCDLCKKYFTKRLFDIHMKKHNKVKYDHCCTICNANFGTNVLLKKHLHVCGEAALSKNSERGKQTTDRRTDSKKTDTDEIQCIYCSKYFKLIVNLKHHIRLCHKNKAKAVNFRSSRIFICDICGKGFDRKIALEDHMNFHTREKTYDCKFCPKIYLTLTSLRGHIRNKHKNITENQSNEDFENSDQLIDETQKVNSSKQVLYCKECGKIFTSKSKLQMHLYYHGRSATYKCEFCPKLCLSMNRLRDHMKLKHEDIDAQIETQENDSEETKITENDKLVDHKTKAKSVRNVCKVCGKSFSRPSKLQQHMNTHTRESAFKCEICSRRYFNVYSLKDHIRLKHKKNKSGAESEQSSEKFDCDVCGKTFNVQWKLENHMNYHTREKTFDCEFCPKSFLSVISLANHVKVHKYDVSECEPRYTRDIEKNMEVDDVHKSTPVEINQNNLKCKTCNKSLNSSEDYVHHVLISSQYGCKRCHKHFEVHKDLEEHMFMYPICMIYKCEYCGQTYREIKTLMLHIHSRHTKYLEISDENIDSFSCSLCDKTFTVYRNLGSHMTAHAECGTLDASSENSNTLLILSKEKTKLNISSLFREEDSSYLQNVKCKFCHEAFDDLDELRTHYLNSTTLGCQVCNRHFKNRRCHREHVNYHLKNTVYQCDYCNKPYINMKSIKKHISSLHPEQTEKKDGKTIYLCHQCDQKLLSLSDLMEHMRQHKGKKPYKCEECNREFSVNEHLEVHKKRRHRNVKPYNCKYCNKPFFRKRTLLRHYGRKHVDRKL